MTQNSLAKVAKSFERSAFFADVINEESQEVSLNCFI